MGGRKAAFFLTLIAGVSLAAISYLFFAAPLGVPANDAYSNPRVPFAAGFFVLGVVITFLSAVVYEIIPDRSGS